MTDDEAPAWQRVEINGIVLHIPYGWDMFVYHDVWYCKVGQKTFLRLEDIKKNGVVVSLMNDGQAV